MCNGDVLCAAFSFVHDAVDATTNVNHLCELRERSIFADGVRGQSAICRRVACLVGAVESARGRVAVQGQPTRHAAAGGHVRRERQIVLAIAMGEGEGVNSATVVGGIQGCGGSQRREQGEIA